MFDVRWKRCRWRYEPQFSGRIVVNILFKINGTTEISVSRVDRGFDYYFNARGFLDQRDILKYTFTFIALPDGSRYLFTLILMLTDVVLSDSVQYITTSPTATGQESRPFPTRTVTGHDHGQFLSPNSAATSICINQPSKMSPLAQNGTQST